MIHAHLTLAVLVIFVLLVCGSRLRFWAGGLGRSLAPWPIAVRSALEDGSG